MEKALSPKFTPLGPKFTPRGEFILKQPRETSALHGVKLHAQVSESIACARRLPVSPVNRVADKKIIIGKNGGPRRRRGTRGRWPKKEKKVKGSSLPGMNSFCMHRPFCSR
jgi:hypothetical protein